VTAIVGNCSGVGVGGNHSIMIVGEGAGVEVTVATDSGVVREIQALNNILNRIIQILFIGSLADYNLGPFGANRYNLDW